MWKMEINETEKNWMNWRLDHTIEKISKSIYRINTGHRKSESNLFHFTKLVRIPKEDDKKEEGQDEENG